MTIYHLSTECYPIAKVGGLADVVGALPKYQNKIKGIEAKVVMPWYNKPLFMIMNLTWFLMVLFIRVRICFRFR
jgi:glycogen synthase